MRGNLTIFKKGLILVSIPLFFQLAFIAVVAVMEKGNAETGRWFLHSKEVLGQAQTVLRGLADAETASRGYAFTGSPVFAEPFSRSAEEVPAALARLQALVSDNPTQEAKVEQIAAKARTILAWHAENVRLTRDGAKQKAAERIMTLRGKNDRDALRADMDDFLTEEQRLEHEREKALQDSQWWLRWLLIGGTVLSLATTAGTAFLFNRGIGARMTTLTANLARLRDRRELVPALHGTDEIGQLDRAIHDMAKTLSSSAQALEEQSRLLRSILDNMGDGVVVADQNGKFLVFNPAAEQILGLGAIDASPDAWTEKYGVYLPDGVTPYPTEQLPLVRAMQGEVVDGLEMFVRHSRRPEGVWLSATARPVQDEACGRRGGVVVIRDISERRRAEEALRRSEQRFRLLVESAVDYALIILDPEGRLVSWNAGAERIKGYHAEEILGRHMSCFYPPEAVERGWPEHELEVAAREGRFEDEGWRVRKDGSRFWANVVITALRNEAGQLEGFSKLTRDLTDRKRAENTIRRLNEDLEKRVLERTADLAEANRDLEQKNQENEMFVYSVSHDLRAPLVNLQGFGEELGMVCQDLRALLADEAVPRAVRERGMALLDGDIAESTRFIQTGVLRLSGIIDALLRLSRAGRVEYRWQKVEVGAVVARVVESLNGTISRRAAKVAYADLPPAWGDPTAIEQVFANLIGNALNYLDPERPGVVEIGSRPAAAADGDAGHAGLHTYYVTDNGLGIPEAYRPKIFQAFQRLNPKAAKGEGIGLVMVRRIVERHGGRIWLESDQGVGSKFFVTLPVPGVKGTANKSERNGVCAAERE